MLRRKPGKIVTNGFQRLEGNATTKGLRQTGSDISLVSFILTITKEIK